MPEPYEVILARVKQKIATQDEWILVEDDLGVIFEGEQAFVISADGIPVNFKIGDGTKKFSELPYFLAYYDGVQSQKRLLYPMQNTNITIANTFRNNSSLYELVFNNTSGAEIPLRIGTTDGGNEILERSLPVGLTTVSRKYAFNAPATVYITGLEGNNYSLVLLYYQYDESPVIPTGGGTGSTLYKKGTMGMFIPLYDGHFDEVWDFITGMGKPDTGYENCSLTEYNGLPSMAGMFPIGAKTGEVAGNRKGNTNNGASIIMDNLPAQGVGLFKAQVSPAGGGVPTTDDNIARARAVNPAADGLNYEMVKSTNGSAPFVGKSANLGIGTKMDITPDSRIVLYFIAIE